MTGYVYVPQRKVSEDIKKKNIRLAITRGQALLITALVILFSYLLTNFVFASEEVKPEAPHKVITIHEGDSLWKIATLHSAETGLEVPELIDQIMELNQMKDVKIYAEQSLKIPLKKP
jgi:LysM repeat protein